MKHSSFSLVFVKLKDFETLRPGWCYGEGVSFSKWAIAAANKVAFSLLAQGFVDQDAFPGINGEIRITAYDEDRYFEFTIDPDYLVTFVRECDGRELEYREGMSLPECLNVINNIGHPQCNLSALSINDTSTGDLAAFKAWRFDPPGTEGYRSFARNVQSQQAVLSAGTFTSSTFTSAANRLFSGPSTAASSRPVMTFKSPPAIPEMLATVTS